MDFRDNLLYRIHVPKRILEKAHLDVSRPKTFLYAALWAAAAVVGVVAVLYARLISHLQNIFFSYFHEYPTQVTLAIPFIFVIATWFVRWFAPNAKGSGIPQVLEAIENAKSQKKADELWKSSLVSLTTALIKILSSCAGILGGASIGREGPTVQIAASGFAWVGHKIRKFAPEIDFQSFLVAGAAAGVAAAFNTPLAGIAFALEEIAEGMFGPFRQIVMLSVIIAGVISQGLAGNYLYFGQPQLESFPLVMLLPQAIVIGIAGGMLGGLFAKILSEPALTRLPTHWVARAFISGAICALLGFITRGDTAGSGYEITKRFLNSTSMDGFDMMMPVYKMITTSFSYLSGMAGGIFSPCLSIGGSLGMTIAKLAHFTNYKACALIGMAAFFSGAVRAPLTSVIIVMEMTDEHLLVLPFMIAAYLAHSIGRRFMPVALYRFLAEKDLRG